MEHQARGELASEVTLPRELFLEAYSIIKDYWDIHEAYEKLEKENWSKEDVLWVVSEKYNENKYSEGE